jgi:hypothetical protein
MTLECFCKLRLIIPNTPKKKRDLSHSNARQLGIWSVGTLIWHRPLPTTMFQVLLIAYCCKNVPLCKNSIWWTQFELNFLGKKLGCNFSILKCTAKFLEHSGRIWAQRKIKARFQPILMALIARQILLQSPMKMDYFGVPLRHLRGSLPWAHKNL